jgi:hypothetical protein
MSCCPAGTTWARGGWRPDVPAAQIDLAKLT